MLVILECVEKQWFVIFRIFCEPQETQGCGK
jgi:hypothetical protein